MNTDTNIRQTNNAKRPVITENVFDRIRREEKERMDRERNSTTEELARRLRKAGSM